MPDIPLTLTVDEAHRRYEAIRPRLPQIGPTGPARLATRLLETAEHYDGYLFDAFGVLNVGETAIPGAAACLAALRAMGKRFCILTNAASYTSAVALAKYHALGLDVRAGEVVSSRDVLFAHLGQTEPGLHWAAICAAGDRFEDAPFPVLDLAGEGGSPRSADGLRRPSGSGGYQAFSGVPLRFHRRTSAWPIASVTCRSRVNWSRSAG